MTDFGKRNVIRELVSSLSQRSDRTTGILRQIHKNEEGALKFIKGPALCRRFKNILEHFSVRHILAFYKKGVFSGEKEFLRIAWAAIKDSGDRLPRDAEFLRVECQLGKLMHTTTKYVK